MQTFDTLARECLAAGMGCAIADGAFNFLETTKVKLQVQDLKRPAYPSRTMSGVIRQASAEDGFVKGLAQPGLAATWLRSFT